MRRTKSRPRLAPEPAVVTKATLRAATQLGLTNKVLASIIGVSEPTVSRMRRGDYTLPPGQKPFELAVFRKHVEAHLAGPESSRAAVEALAPGRIDGA